GQGHGHGHGQGHGHGDLLSSLALGIGGVVGFMFALAFVPLGGAPGGLARGLGIAAVELALAWWLALPRRGPGAVAPGARAAATRDALALKLPGVTKHGRVLGSVGLVAAPILGVVLFFVGRLVASLVPATGRAPIELFVELPSGRLAVALVAVVVPVAEEIFFRGFVYGAAERAKGANVATALTVIAFALVHLPQQWGAWGAFASVTLTGLVLTLLRRFTGSTLVPALAHLGHNGLITLVSL
ncbi:MAG: CPBP family intramembrane metalloprotease, partial [Myxococcales bacterium]|nr:CPBP family intramembrane metalloprotease [Myxococcales bacterium]